MKPAVPGAKQPGMIRETFRHAAIYSGATMLGRTVGFFMLPFYAHILRDVGYGVIGMIDASLVLLSSLVGYSLRTAVLRIYHEEPDPARKPKVASTAALLIAWLLLPISAAAALFSKPLSSLMLGTGEYWVLICLAMASFYLDMIVQTANSILVIQRRSITYSLIGLMRLIVGLGLNIWLVVILRWDLLGFFLSGLVVAVLTLGVSMWLLWRTCGLGYDKELARRLIDFQAPLIPGSLARFFGRQVERVMVRYLIDLRSVGILEMGYKFPVLINMLVVTPFNQSWGTKVFEIADQPGAPVRISQMFSYYVYLMILAGLVLSVNIHTILQLLTPSEFWFAHRIARIDTLSVIIHGIGMHLCFGITYAKRTAIIARMAIATTLLKLVLSYAMISLWGLYGASWSGVIVTTVYTVWGYLVAQSFYRLPLEWPKLGLIVGAAIVLLLGIDALSQEAIVAWGAPFLASVQDGLEGLRDTWFGGLRDGKVLRLLIERSDLVLDIVVRTALVALYLTILPLVHVETQRKVQRRLSLLTRRA